MMLEEVIKYRNVSGKVYMSDILKWLGLGIGDLRVGALQELQDLITEVADARSILAKK